MNERTQRELRRRVEALTSLTEHPAWPEWKDEMDRKRAKDEQAFISRYLRAGDPVDQRKFDEFTGFWRGVNYALGVPEKAADTFERALREAHSKDGD